MKKSWTPATVKIAKKYSQPVTPAQSKFAGGLKNVVTTFVDVGKKKKR